LWIGIDNYWMEKSKKKNFNNKNLKNHMWMYYITLHMTKKFVQLFYNFWQLFDKKIFATFLQLFDNSWQLFMYVFGPQVPPFVFLKMSCEVVINVISFFMTTIS
jgi:hypothetical protein